MPSTHPAVTRGRPRPFDRRGGRPSASAERLEARTLRSTTYDPATDFSLTANPNGIWSYGELPTETSAFVPYPAEGVLDVGPPVQGWHTAGTSSPPYVGINPSAAAVSGSTVVVPAGAIDMHPGPGGEYSDVRLTVPAAGPATIAVTFTGIDVDGTTTDVHVLHNGTSIADGLVNGYGDTFTRELTLAAVAPGDTIDFIVGYGSNQNYYSDSTELSAQVTVGTAAKSIGGLDPAFGVNGLASHDVGFTATTGVAADGAQSVLVGPVGASPTQSFGVTRYNADGSLDTTFGTGGVVETSFAGTDAVPSAVAALADGDILVAGTATTHAADGTVAGSQFAVAEYTAAGALDAAFGTGGEALFGLGATLSNDVLRALAVGPGGLIYLGGSSDAAGQGNADLAVARLTAAGALDPTFGAGGKALVDVAGGDDVVNGLAVQANGAVIAAGSAVVGGVTEVALARFLATGLLDKHFGTKGITTTKVGGVYDAAESVVVQPKGQIVVGGLAASGAGAALSSDFLVQRYTSAGRLDRTFGAGGTTVTSFGQPSAVTQVVLQGDGSIVASGRTSATLGGTLDVALARYTTRGALDTGFAGTGKVVVDLAVGVVANPAALRAAIASSLGAAFDAFTSSAQGVVAITAGGEILSAGNSGANTVEAELVAAGVDLVAKLLSSLPASVLGGLKGTATITVTESGTTQAVGSVTIQLQFAASATGAAAASLKPVAERVNLRQGQGKPFKLPFTYPTGLPSGEYYLLATVTNGAGVPADLDAANNMAASPAAVLIAPPFTSLSGSELTAASAFVAGKMVTVSLVVANGGNVPAKGQSTVDFYLSTDATVADGTLLTIVPLPLGLPAGKSKPYRFRFALPKTASAGTFDLLAILDPANSLGTNNNSGALVVDSTAVTVQ